MKNDAEFLANIHDDVYDLNGKRRSISGKKKSSSLSKTPEINVVNLPSNLYTPDWGRAFDFRKLVEISANSGKQLLFEFKVPKGETLMWTHYALFNDSFSTALNFFDITINDNKVLKYHGDPSDDFKLSLGGNASLDNSGLFEANIRVLQGQTIKWYVTNDDNVDVTMGARMKGYVDNSNKSKSTRFGG